MEDRGKKEAWVTLATNDAYALGCLVLGNSLRRVNTTRQLVAMYTEGVSEEMRRQLSLVFDHLVEVTTLDSEDSRNLSLLGRPDLNVTFTKIHCWELTQYQKAVFLDADTLLLQNSDELFDREELSAAPDAGWPDCFNSGVFVFVPSLDTYQRLIAFAQSTGSFDGGDQGLLNSYFNMWSTTDIHKHLPFIYNVVSQAFYSYLPAFTQFRDNIKIVHFIGAIKPWHHPYNTATKTVTTFPETGHSQEFLQFWWDLFMELVQPRLDPTLWCSFAKPYILLNLFTGQSEKIVMLFVDFMDSVTGQVQPVIKKSPSLTKRIAQLLQEDFQKGILHTPFIRFEYVLPSPPPPLPSSSSCSSQHGREESPPPPPHRQEDPQTYQVLYPYVPPALDQEFYTPPCNQQWESSPPPHAPSPHTHHHHHDYEHDHHYDHSAPHHHQDEGCAVEAAQEDHHHEGDGGPHVVDMPIIMRSFHTYETHYTEEPLLLIDPDSPPPALYESVEFESILVKEAEKIVPEEPKEPVGAELVISIVDESQKEKLSDSKVLTNGTSTEGGSEGTVEAEEKTFTNGVISASDGPEVVSPTKKPSVVSVLKEKSSGGLVGELAQMKVGGGETANYIVLDDRERRLAWERGHADYLGADSFVNIMRKLDEKMAPLPPGKEGSRPVKEGSQSEAALDKPAEKKPTESSGSGSRSSRSSRRASRPRSHSVGVIEKWEKEDKMVQEQFVAELEEKLKAVKIGEENTGVAEPEENQEGVKEVKCGEENIGVAEQEENQKGAQTEEGNTDPQASRQTTEKSSGMPFSDAKTN